MTYHYNKHVMRIFCYLFIETLSFKHYFYTSLVNKRIYYVEQTDSWGFFKSQAVILKHSETY